MVFWGVRTITTTSCSQCDNHVDSSSETGLFYPLSTLDRRPICASSLWAMEECYLDFPGSTGPAKASLPLLAPSHKGDGVCSHQQQSNASTGRCRSRARGLSSKWGSGRCSPGAQAGLCLQPVLGFSKNVSTEENETRQAQRTRAAPCNIIWGLAEQP